MSSKRLAEAWYSLLCCADSAAVGSGMVSSPSITSGSSTSTCTAWAGATASGRIGCGAGGGVLSPPSRSSPSEVNLRRSVTVNCGSFSRMAFSHLFVGFGLVGWLRQWPGDRGGRGQRSGHPSFVGDLLISFQYFHSHKPKCQNLR